MSGDGLLHQIANIFPQTAISHSITGQFIFPSISTLITAVGTKIKFYNYVTPQPSTSSTLHNDLHNTDRPLSHDATPELQYLFEIELHGNILGLVPIVPKIQLYARYYANTDLSLELYENSFKSTEKVKKHGKRQHNDLNNDKMGEKTISIEELHQSTFTNSQLCNYTRQYQHCYSLSHTIHTSTQSQSSTATTTTLGSTFFTHSHHQSLSTLIPSLSYEQYFELCSLCLDQFVVIVASNETIHWSILKYLPTSQWYSNFTATALSLDHTADTIIDSTHSTLIHDLGKLEMFNIQQLAINTIQHAQLSPHELSLYEIATTKHQFKAMVDRTSSVLIIYSGHGILLYVPLNIFGLPPLQLQPQLNSTSPPSRPSTSSQKTNQPSLLPLNIFPQPNQLSEYSTTQRYTQLVEADIISLCLHNIPSNPIKPMYSPTHNHTDENTLNSHQIPSQEDFILIVIIYISPIGHKHLKTYTIIGDLFSCSDLFLLAHEPSSSSSSSSLSFSPSTSTSTAPVSKHLPNPHKPASQSNFVLVSGPWPDIQIDPTMSSLLSLTTNHHCAASPSGSFNSQQQHILDISGLLVAGSHTIITLSLNEAKLLQLYPHLLPHTSKIPSQNSSSSNDINVALLSNLPNIAQLPTTTNLRHQFFNIPFALSDFTISIFSRAISLSNEHSTIFQPQSTPESSLTSINLSLLSPAPTPQTSTHLFPLFPLTAVKLLPPEFIYSSHMQLTPASANTKLVLLANNDGRIDCLTLFTHIDSHTSSSFSQYQSQLPNMDDQSGLLNVVSKRRNHQGKLLSTTSTTSTTSTSIKSTPTVLSSPQHVLKHTIKGSVQYLTRTSPASTLIAFSSPPSPFPSASLLSLHQPLLINPTCPNAAFNTVFCGSLVNDAHLFAFNHDQTKVLSYLPNLAPINNISTTSTSASMTMANQIPLHIPSSLHSATPTNLSDSTQWTVAYNLTSIVHLPIYSSFADILAIPFNTHSNPQFKQYLMQILKQRIHALQTNSSTHLLNDFINPALSSPLPQITPPSANHDAVNKDLYNIDFSSYTSPPSSFFDSPSAVHPPNHQYLTISAYPGHAKIIIFQQGYKLIPTRLPRSLRHFSNQPRSLHTSSLMTLLTRNSQSTFSIIIPSTSHAHYTLILIQSTPITQLQPHTARKSHQTPSNISFFLTSTTSKPLDCDNNNDMDDSTVTQLYSSISYIPDKIMSIHTISPPINLDINTLENLNKDTSTPFIAISTSESVYLLPLATSPYSTHPTDPANTLKSLPNTVNSAIKLDIIDILIQCQQRSSSSLSSSSSSFISSSTTNTINTATPQLQLQHLMQFAAHSKITHLTTPPCPDLSTTTNSSSSSSTNSSNPTQSAQFTLTLAIPTALVISEKKTKKVGMTTPTSVNLSFNTTNNSSLSQRKIPTNMNDTDTVLLSDSDIDEEMSSQPFEAEQGETIDIFSIGILSSTHRNQIKETTHLMNQNKLSYVYLVLTFDFVFSGSDTLHNSHNSHYSHNCDQDDNYAPLNTSLSNIFVFTQPISAIAFSSNTTLALAFAHTSQLYTINLAAEGIYNQFVHQTLQNQQRIPFSTLSSLTIHLITSRFNSPPPITNLKLQLNTTPFTNFSVDFSVDSCINLYHSLSSLHHHQPSLISPDLPHAALLTTARNITICTFCQISSTTFFIGLNNGDTYLFYAPFNSIHFITSFNNPFIFRSPPLDHDSSLYLPSNISTIIEPQCIVLSQTQLILYSTHSLSPHFFLISIDYIPGSSIKIVVSPLTLPTSISLSSNFTLSAINSTTILVSTTNHSSIYSLSVRSSLVHTSYPYTSTVCPTSPIKPIENIQRIAFNPSNSILCALVSTTYPRLPTFSPNKFSSYNSPYAANQGQSQQHLTTKSFKSHLGLFNRVIHRSVVPPTNLTITSNKSLYNATTQQILETNEEISYDVPFPLTNPNINMDYSHHYPQSSFFSQYTAPITTTVHNYNNHRLQYEQQLTSTASTTSPVALTVNSVKLFYHNTTREFTISPSNDKFGIKLENNLVRNVHDTVSKTSDTLCDFNAICDNERIKPSKHIATIRLLPFEKATAICTLSLNNGPSGYPQGYQTFVPQTLSCPILSHQDVKNLPQQHSTSIDKNRPSVGDPEAKSLLQHLGHITLPYNQHICYYCTHGRDNYYLATNSLNSIISNPKNQRNADPSHSIPSLPSTCNPSHTSAAPIKTVFAIATSFTSSAPNNVTTSSPLPQQQQQWPAFSRLLLLSATPNPNYQPNSTVITSYDEANMMIDPQQEYIVEILAERLIGGIIMSIQPYLNGLAVAVGNMVHIYNIFNTSVNPHNPLSSSELTHISHNDWYTYMYDLIPDPFANFAAQSLVYNLSVDHCQLSITTFQHGCIQVTLQPHTLTCTDYKAVLQQLAANNHPHVKYLNEHCICHNNIDNKLPLRPFAHKNAQINNKSMCDTSIVYIYRFAAVGYSAEKKYLLHSVPTHDYDILPQVPALSLTIPTSITSQDGILVDLPSSTQNMDGNGFSNLNIAQNMVDFNPSNVTTKTFPSYLSLLPTNLSTYYNTSCHIQSHDNGRIDLITTASHIKSLAHRKLHAQSMRQQQKQLSASSLASQNQPSLPSMQPHSGDPQLFINQYTLGKISLYDTINRFIAAPSFSSLSPYIPTKPQHSECSTAPKNYTSPIIAMVAQQQQYIDIITKQREDSLQFFLLQPYHSIFTLLSPLTTFPTLTPFINHPINPIVGCTRGGALYNTTPISSSFLLSSIILQLSILVVCSQPPHSTLTIPSATPAPTSSTSASVSSTPSSLAIAIDAPFNVNSSAPLTALFSPRAIKQSLVSSQSSAAITTSSTLSSLLVSTNYLKFCHPLPIMELILQSTSPLLFMNTNTTTSTTPHNIPNRSNDDMTASSMMLTTPTICHTLFALFLYSFTALQRYSVAMLFYQWYVHYTLRVYQLYGVLEVVSLTASQNIHQKNATLASTSDNSTPIQSTNSNPNLHIDLAPFTNNISLSSLPQLTNAINTFQQQSTQFMTQFIPLPRHYATRNRKDVTSSDDMHGLLISVQYAIEQFISTTLFSTPYA